MSAEDRYHQMKLLGEDPNARVMVFVDGQNLYQRCKSIFGYPMCHPHLLAEALAGARTNHPPRTRFYTGRPNPNIEGESQKVRNLDRRLAAMRKVGVDVITRPLRYHWEWGHRARLPEPKPGAPEQTVNLSPYARPSEKGIDLVMGLDVMEFVLSEKCDVAIIVSLDRDLYEIPQAIRHVAGDLERPVRVEAAVPVSSGRRKPKVLSQFHYTHQITRELFERVRDDTFYAAPDDEWRPPDIPATLKEADSRQKENRPG